MRGSTQRSTSQLPVGWRLARASGVPQSLLEDFVRPALRAVPQVMAARLGRCHVLLQPQLPDATLSSQWSFEEVGVRVTVATSGAEPHDVAMEVLLCLGEALWDKATEEELEAYLRLLYGEIATGVDGEIDEGALHQKNLLLSSPVLARSRRRLLQYARASYAATAAEYVHCLWHDVTVRCGPEHLPARWLRRRLELLAGWFPPDRGYRLFPDSPKKRGRRGPR